jgi:hypothetical protein
MAPVVSLPSANGQTIASHVESSNIFQGHWEPQKTVSDFFTLEEQMYLQVAEEITPYTEASAKQALTFGAACRAFGARICFPQDQ